MLCDLHPGELRAREHVLGDGHRRERVRLLEHHADAAPDLHRAHRRARRCPCRRAAPGPTSRAFGTSSCVRFSVRMNVDFPQPDGPISAVTVRAGIVEVHALEDLVRAEPRAHVLGDHRRAGSRPGRTGTRASSVVGRRRARWCRVDVVTSTASGCVGADFGRDEQPGRGEEEQARSREHERAGPRPLRSAASSRPMRICL